MENEMRKLLCKIGLHKWEIRPFVNERNKLKGFNRHCFVCDCDQDLMPTKHYSVGQYVWTESNKTP